LTKANNEVALWRHKCESGEGGVRSEELEEMKRKFNVKITELEAQLDAAQSKASSLEKVKNRLQGELDDLTVEVERVSYSSKGSNTFIFSILYSASYHFAISRDRENPENFRACSFVRQPDVCVSKR
jgi:TolA-binding protein